MPDRAPFIDVHTGERVRWPDLIIGGWYVARIRGRRVVWGVWRVGGYGSPYLVRPKIGQRRAIHYARRCDPRPDCVKGTPDAE